LYSSPVIRQIKSRRMRWAGHVARMGEGRNVCRVLVGKPEGKRPFERPRRRWEDGNKMDLKEIGWGGVEWIHLAQDRDWWRAVVNAVMNLRVLAPRVCLNARYRNARGKSVFRDRMNFSGLLITGPVLTEGLT
jgi:hypothetical protein